MKFKIITLTICLFAFGFTTGYSQKTKTYSFVIEPQFNWAGDFHELAAWIQINDKYSYVLADGEILFYPPKYDYCYDWSEGCAVVKTGMNSYKWINLDAQTVISVDHCVELARGFSEGLIACKINNKGWGYASKSGVIAIQGQYKSIWSGDFHEGLASVCMSGDWSNYWGPWGFIDKSGKVVIQGKFNMRTEPMNCPPEFSDGLAAISEWNGNGKYGFINKSGEFVIPAQYEEACNFSEGLAAVQINDRWGFINKKGVLVIPAKFRGEHQYYHGFKDGMALVGVTGKDGKWFYGFIDKTGKMVFSLKQKGITKAHNFSEGLAAVEINGKWGYVDKTGKLVIPAVFESCGDFHEGLASVRVNNLYGFIKYQ